MGMMNRWRKWRWGMKLGDRCGEGGKRAVHGGVAVE